MIRSSFRCRSVTAPCSIPDRGRRRFGPPAPVFLCALLAACAGARDAPHAPPDPYTAVTVYVAAAGWHADLIVPRAAIPPDLWPEAADFPGARYLRVGWGDRDYYPARRFNLWYGLKALFWPTASVLHVVGFRRAPAMEYPHDRIVALDLAPAGARALFRYIDAAYQRDGAARAPRLAASPYGSGWFYPAEGSFHLFRTCNVWTAQALAAAGLPVRATLALTVDSVLAQVRPLGHVVGPRAAGAGCPIRGDQRVGAGGRTR